MRNSNEIFVVLGVKTLLKASVEFDKFPSEDAALKITNIMQNRFREREREGEREVEKGRGRVGQSKDTEKGDGKGSLTSEDSHGDQRG
jgi:hypothetical protein